MAYIMACNLDNYSFNIVIKADFIKMLERLKSL